MSKTIAEIVDGAAKRLGLVGEGQTLRSNHSSDLTAAYDEKYAELEGLQIPTWSSTASIPDQYVWAMTALVAESRVMEYSPPPNRAQAIRLDALEAMRRIRKMQEKPMMGETEAVNY